MNAQKSWFVILKMLLKGFVGVYVLVVLLLLWFETKLVFPGAPPTRGNYQPNFAIEDVQYPSADGTQLHAWLLPRPGSKRYLLYCHGNAENVAMSSAYFARVIGERLDANTLVFDYRGYGKSAGKPSEKGILQDAEASMEWLCNRFEIEPTDVVVVGLSLGGGPATHLASKVGCRGLILERTFSSVTDVAASKYPFVPVHLCMQNRFESAKKISTYHGPLLQSHGGADRVVPWRFGKKLHDACPAQDKTFFTKPEMNHFSDLHDEFQELIAEFGDRVYGQH